MMLWVKWCFLYSEFFCNGDDWGKFQVLFMIASSWGMRVGDSLLREISKWILLIIFITD